MELSDVLLFVHIVAAMAWLGGGVLGSVMASRMKTADPEHRLGFARFMRKASTGLFMPAAIVVLLAGTWLVIDSDVFEFDQLWISIGFGIVLITAAMGPLFFKPTLVKGIAGMEAGDGPAVGAAMQRLGIGSRVALVLEFIAVWAMVVKPGL
jgi:uncharacterized membrane protein